MNAIEELQQLITYIDGMVDNEHNERKAEKLERASLWLGRLSEDICGQGFIGCNGGRECGSDHK